MFFFFKQKTAYEMRISDWSSDVCSSDLVDQRDSDLPDRQLQEVRGPTCPRGERLVARGASGRPTSRRLPFSICTQEHRGVGTRRRRQGSSREDRKSVV